MAALWIVTALSTALAADDPAATEMMVCNDAATKVTDAKAELTMVLTDSSGGQRVRKLVMMTKLEANGLDNMRLLRFTAPADIKGTVTLLIEQRNQDDDMWIYLPALKKVRRLVADNKRDSFVGSDLTFGDIIGHKPIDWSHQKVREDTVDGRAVSVIESLPRNDRVRSSSGYSKRITWVDRESCLALKTDYWDEAGQMMKSILASQIKLVDEIGHKWQFMHVEASNQQSSHRTMLNFDHYAANQGLTDELFTPQAMER
ncbi:MAG: outer membrane lipoprotein-sorting protein [Magnetococcales bacterium]|nr:outer membrane lipoprotein-sorting protein [Magnetococcales bacterium]